MDTESVMKQLQAMEAKIEKLTGNILLDNSHALTNVTCCS